MQHQESVWPPHEIADFEHQCWREANPWAIAFTERHINQRPEEHASWDMVIEVSLSRYYLFMETARSELVDRLSEAELTLLLNAHPHTRMVGRVPRARSRANRL